MVPVVKLHNGFLSHLTFRQHQGTVPNPVRGRLADYGYKTCADWDDPGCGHIPSLGMRERPRLDISRRYPRRPDDAPRAPKWLREVRGPGGRGEPATPEALAVLRAVAGVELPDDLIDFLRWSDGIEVYDISVLSAERCVWSTRRRQTRACSP